MSSNAVQSAQLPTFSPPSNPSASNSSSSHTSTIGDASTPTKTSWLPVTTRYAQLADSKCGEVYRIWMKYHNTYEYVNIAYAPGQDNGRPCLPQEATRCIGPVKCPQAYSTVFSSLIAGSSDALIGCCPSDYIFATLHDPRTLGQCTSTVTPSQSFRFNALATNSIGSYMFAPTVSVVATASYVFAVPFNGVKPAEKTKSNFWNEGRIKVVTLGILAFVGVIIAMILLYTLRRLARLRKLDDEANAHDSKPSSASGNEAPDTNQILELTSEELKYEVASNRPLAHELSFKSPEEELSQRREVHGWDAKFEPLLT
ncbi:hypothetical protein B0J14DRAFT_636035 [Halenospora varia]|nr:hypothetical protein B0J14DRAFT_636035 [Halenospora varia]